MHFSSRSCSPAHARYGTLVVCGSHHVEVVGSEDSPPELADPTAGMTPRAMAVQSAASRAPPSLNLSFRLIEDTPQMIVTAALGDPCRPHVRSVVNIP